MPTTRKKLIVTPPEIPGVSPGDLTARPAEPGARWQTRLTIGTVIAGFAAFLQVYATQPLLPALRRLFQASELRVSLTVSAVTIAVALGSPVVGLLADLIGRKRIIVPAILAMSVPMVLSATATTLNQLIFWRFLQGLFVPGIIAVTVAYIAEESPPGTSATVTAAYVTGTVAGGLSGRLISALTADYFGWRWAFVLLGVMTFLCGLLTWVLLAALAAIPPHGRPGGLAAGHGRPPPQPEIDRDVPGRLQRALLAVGVFTYANFLLAAPPFRLSTTALGFCVPRLRVGAGGDARLGAVHRPRRAPQGLGLRLGLSPPGRPSRCRTCWPS